MDSALTRNRKHWGKHPYRGQWKCQIKRRDMMRKDRPRHRVYHKIGDKVLSKCRWQPSDRCCLTFLPRQPSSSLVHPQTTEITSVNRVQLGHISWLDQTQEQTCLGAQRFLKGRARERDSTSLSDTGPRAAAIRARRTLISVELICLMCTNLKKVIFCFTFVARLKEHRTDVYMSELIY